MLTWMFFFSIVEASSIRYHQLCISDRSRLCFRDDVYLCLCIQDHQRVECFRLRWRSRSMWPLSCRWTLSPGKSSSIEWFSLSQLFGSFDAAMELNTKLFSLTVYDTFPSDRISLDLFLNHKHRKNSLLILFLLSACFLRKVSFHPSIFFVYLGFSYGVSDYRLSINHINQLFLWLLPCPLWASTIFGVAQPLHNPEYCTSFNSLLFFCTVWIAGFYELFFSKSYPSRDHQPSWLLKSNIT